MAPGHPQQWSLQNTGQAVNGTSGTSGADIRWLEAMRLAPATGDVIVAVDGVEKDVNANTASLYISSYTIFNLIAVNFFQVKLRYIWSQYSMSGLGLFAASSSSSISSKAIK